MIFRGGGGDMDIFWNHTLNGEFVQHVFACILWHKPDENPDRFENPPKTRKLEVLIYTDSV